MKRSILLLSACLVAGLTNAQQAQKSLVFNAGADHVTGSNNYQISTAKFTPAVESENYATKGYKTTSSGRWYDYMDSVLFNNSSLTAANTTDLDIWQDTTSLWGYSTPEYDGNPWTSMGLLLDPFAPQWADPSLFGGEPSVRTTDAYTIDMIKIYGFYGRNPLKPTIVDTLIVTFVDGDGSTTANLAGGLAYTGSLAGYYGVTSLNFISMYHDSLHNRAGASSAALTIPIPPPVALPNTSVYKFLLVNTDSVTTGTLDPVTGTLGSVYPRPGHIPADPAISYAVPAGHYASMSVSFKSGDTWPSSYLPSGYKDTIRYASGAHKYGGFSPIIGYDAVSTAAGANAEWVPYLGGGTPPDWTNGYFKMEGARDAGSGGLYIPNWGWTTSNGTQPSALQYPDFWFHINCPTCPPVGDPALGVKEVSGLNDVQAYPNPSVDELNITFTVSQNGAASVTLTDMVGQVVATQKTNNGKVSFNTTALPNGVYMYSVQANGDRSTGRVVVAH